MRAYFELLRLPAVFTAVADVMMGYLVTRGDLRPLSTFVLLVVTSCCLYLAGMVLNDAFDAEVDARERPQRPIPSGRVTRRAAKTLGWGLWASGMVAGGIIAAVTGTWRPAVVATLLAACVVLYDIHLKRTALAAPVMGACRILNVLLGMSLATATRWPHELRPWNATEWAIALGVGGFVAGVTWFARTEASVTNRARLLASTAMMLVGVTALSASPRFTVPRSVRLIVEQDGWPLLWIVIALLILRHCVKAMMQPSPQYVQTTVRHCLRSIILIDAAVVLGFCGVFWGCAVLLLLVPMWVLERWASTT